MIPSKSYLVGAEKLCYPENKETLGDRTQNKAQRLAACGNVSVGSQSLSPRFF